VRLKFQVFWDATQCNNLKDLNLHAVVHVNVMYIVEAAAVCIFEYLFQLLTVLQLLAIKQKPGKSATNSWKRHSVLYICITHFVKSIPNDQIPLLAG
jgi:hypothetical protein